jgi:hypothetical protein
VFAFGGMRDEDFMILFFMAFASIWLGVFFIPLIIAIFRGLTSGASFHTALIAVAIAAFVFFVGGNILRFYRRSDRKHCRSSPTRSWRIRFRSRWWAALPP